MANSYETYVTIPSFQGIDQSMGEHNINLEYAVDARNVTTKYGTLANAKGFTAYKTALPGRAVTMTRFYRRLFEDESKRNLLVVSTDRHILIYEPGGSLLKQYTHSAAFAGGGRWSCAVYEVQRSGSEEPVDALYMTNAQDGMFIVYGDTLDVSPVELMTDSSQYGIPMTNSKGEPFRIGQLGRHEDRLWAVQVNNDPDYVYWSQPESVEYWGVRVEAIDGSDAPEDLIEASGGFTERPTWDGDMFTGLHRLGNALVVFKRNSIFRILGVNPGEFHVREAMGDAGLIAPDTVVSSQGVLYYLSEHGLTAFDGSLAQPLNRDSLREVFDNLADGFETLACARINEQVLYLALPVKTDTEPAPTRNNILIEYDLRRGTYMLRDGIVIDTMLAYEGKMMFAGGASTANIYLFDGSDYGGANMRCRWVSPWQDLGAKNVMKSGFAVLFTGIGGQDVPLNITIETEKKSKSKQIMATVGQRKTRLRVGGRGRRFRLIIETNSTGKWWISGGLQIYMETDAD